ncbi:hypothetical protein C2E21_5977 [Chlorella sorokiniana]|uniref:Uncharacterized protein n=1 Tax=Chlorella sorokiniana TaxID=3076 RepID=A0A2P6TM17_CHLSO|nr:hypothetical protein C2E21_5977 [Chlorella sorokiniana]|eukprot:PRW45372.1 hypothetical protein C2E21_5977 [Chlorella sorokiniana]
MSAQLVWELVKKNNAFIRKSVNHTVFSAEPGNVANKHSYKYSGLANRGATVDVAAANGAVVISKSSKKGKLAGSVCKKNARRTNHAAAAEAQSAGRPDLKSAAQARASALSKGIRKAKAVAASQMSTHPVAVERRALLKYILQDLQARGVEVLLPVGCSDFDEWLLDALSAERLLKQLRGPTKPARLDLINACVSASTGPLATGRRDSWQMPPRVGRESMSHGGDEVPLVDIRSLLHADSSATPGESQQAAAPAGPDEAADGAPQLRLRSLQVGLREHQLKELAYAVFLSCCGKTASRGLLASLRASLELPEARAGELARITELASKAGVASLASLDAHIKLLQTVRPTAFDSFRNFVKWRDTVTSVVWLVLSQAAREAWVATPGGTVAAAPATDAAARTLLARLKGGLRRLDVRTADEYDDAEYAEAVEAVFAAAERLAKHCQTGWTFPWGLRARLAELLLRGMFDTLDEGQYTEQRQELLSALQGSVWRELQIGPDVHNAVFAWVHYRQFAVSQELLLLEVSRQAIQQIKAVPALPPADGGSSPLLVTKEQADAAFPAEVVACISEAVCGTLSRYHAAVDNPRVMKGLVGVLDAAEAACGRREGLPALLEGCIAASVEAAFDASLAELSANVSAEEDLIMLLAASCAELYKQEATVYAPLLAPAQPAARVIAARSLHEVYGAKMLPWLIGVNGLTKSALEAIRASMALEELLLEECRESPDAQIAPWGTMERLSPLLYTWAQGQITMLGGWMDRILASEDWTRVSKQRAHGSRSVVETIKIVTETLEALFNMRLAIPAGVVRCLTEGVDNALQKYCDFVRTQVGSPDALIPPPPPLTRYKRELAVAAEEAAAAAANGVPAGQLSKVKNKMADAFTPNWLPPLGATEEERRVDGLSYDGLVVRLNSVQHLLDSLGGLERMVVDRWDDGRPRSAKAREGAHAYDWIAGMFDGARRTAARTRDHLARFIAVKVVFGDLRDVIFERLYRFHVQVSRLELVLQEVDRLLGDICGRVHDALPPRLGRAVCAALASAVQSVLLDGGPYRLFTPQDVDLLEADLAQMRAMFYADGDGISLEEVDALCRPLSDVVDAMQLDTGLVIQNLKQAQASGGRGAPSPRGTPAAMNPDVLLRILCHRADHAASKFLKKDYKIPKKIPGGLSASVSDVAQKAGGLLRRSKTSPRG